MATGANFCKQCQILWTPLSLSLKAFFSNLCWRLFPFLSRVDSRLPHVSADVPFDISGDRATKTHCSESSTLQQITSDVRIVCSKDEAYSEGMHAPVYSPWVFSRRRKGLETVMVFLNFLCGTRNIALDRAARQPMPKHKALCTVPKVCRMLRGGKIIFELLFISEFRWFRTEIMK